MAFIYCADVWCDDCGEAIRQRLTNEGKAPAVTKTAVMTHKAGVGRARQWTRNL
jgi:hypothetical protein